MVREGSCLLYDSDEMVLTIERQPRESFILSRCLEWKLLRTPDMAVSASIADDELEAVLFPEEMRTGATLYAQEYMHTFNQANWIKLTHAQTQDRLQPHEYRQLCLLEQECVPDQETYEALQYINLIHDIGKNPAVMRAVNLVPGKHSHDEALRRLFSPEYETEQKLWLSTYANPHIFNDYQRGLIHGVCTTRFNLPRFMYSQCSHEEIAEVETMEPATLKLAILHGMQDIAGAQGHKSMDTSLTLTSPTVTRMLDAAYVLLGDAHALALPEGTTVTPAIRAALYEVLRAEQTGITSPSPEAEADEVALFFARTNLANFFKRTTPQEMAPLLAAYDALPLLLKRKSSHILACLALEPPDPFMKPYALDYVPAFMRSITGSTDPEAYKVVMGYFSQVFDHAISIEYDDAIKNNAAMPSVRFYDHINFYHLAKWLAARQPDYNRSIRLRYEKDGTTLTPIPLEDDENKGAAYYLVPYTIFDIKGK